MHSFLVFVTVLVLFPFISQSQSCPPTDGFESGYNGFAVQDFSSALYAAVIGTSGRSVGFGFFSSQPTEGTYAFLNGFDAGTASNLKLSKTMQWSAQSVTLDYRYGWDLSSYCTGSCLPRFFQLNFYTTGGQLLVSNQILTTGTLPQRVTDSGPLSATVDTSAVVGMTVVFELQWVVPESSTGPAFFQLDNIRYTNCAPAATCTPSCQNGGTCVANNTCSCPANFTGAVCEHRIATPALPFASTSACADMSDQSSPITFPDPVPYGYYVIGARLQLNVTTFCNPSNITATLNGIQIGTQSVGPLCNCSSEAVLLDIFSDHWNSSYSYGKINSLLIEGDNIAWTTPVLDLYIWDTGCPDGVPPTINTCPSPVTLTTSPSTCGINTPDLVSQAEAVSNCGAVFINQSIAAGSLLYPGVRSIDLSFSDYYGVHSSCTTIVTVIDSTPPAVQCPAPITLNADSVCQAQLPSLLPSVTASDACGVTTIQDPIASSLIPYGLTTVNVTGTDPSGNTASCQASVNVVDTTLPLVTCPADITISACDYTAENYTSQISFSDNCGIDAISQSVAVGQYLIQGSHPVAITVTDIAGNQASCTFNIHVIDFVTPTITCNAPSILTVDDQCQISVPNVTGLVTAEDDCIVFLNQSPAPNSQLWFTVNYSVNVTASDLRGNNAECQKDIQVIDTINPVLQCTSDITIQVDSFCQASIPSIVPFSNFTDNCGIVQMAQIPAAGAVHTRGNYSVSLTACDHFHNQGSCESIIRMVDSIFPTISCPATIVLNASDMCQVSLPDFMALSVATDNCGFTLSQFPAVDTPLGLGEFPVTVRVTDYDGNFQECTSSVVVIDQSEPVLSPCVPSRVHKKTDCDEDPNYTEIPSFIVHGFELAFDNCNLTQVIQSPLPGTPVPVGTYNITLTFIDASGNEMTCRTEYKYEEADPSEEKGMDKGTLVGVAVGVPGGMGISGVLAFFAWSKLRKFIKIDFNPPSMNVGGQLVVTKPTDDVEMGEGETQAINQIVVESEGQPTPLQPDYTSREEKPIPDEVDNPSGSRLGSSSTILTSQTSGTQAYYDTPDSSESE